MVEANGLSGKWVSQVKGRAEGDSSTQEPSADRNGGDSFAESEYDVPSLFKVVISHLS